MVRRSLEADLRLYASLLGYSESECTEMASEGSTVDRMLVRDRLRREYLTFGSPAMRGGDLSGLEQLEVWEEPPGGRFVYFIQSGDAGPVKIGMARDPLVRMGELQTGNPEQLYLRHVVPGARRLEAELHHRFREARVRGEWFGRAYLDLILVYAAGLADQSMQTLRSTSEGGVQIERRLGELSRWMVVGQIEVDELRREIEGLWRTGFSEEEITEFVYVTQAEVGRQLAFMRKSPYYEVKGARGGYPGLRASEARF